jgi:asparagine synthase (glutamine-hydrolysing)
MSVQTSGIGRCAAGFSGGVDSAVLAKIAAEAGIDLLLLTVGFGRTPEMSQAKSAAEAIGLPIVMREFTEEDLRECVDRVLWLIEEPNLMKVSVAVAVYWTAELAVEHGRSVIVLGQGSDELFGGYKRFATILGIEGSAAAREAISESVRNAHHVNFQRDEQATSSLRVELRLPFATRKIVNCASLIPLKMKVGSPTDDLRKWILRLAALDLGVPREIAMLRKRAIQHGSGIEKGIRDIAKKEHLTPSSYLESRFQSIKSQFEKR